MSAGQRLERLGAALSKQGFELRGAVDFSGLATLNSTLQAQNIVLDSETLRQVVWTALGQPRPRTVNLAPEARARLSHLTDLRDVFSPADAERVGREFAGERWLAPDLLAARPWLMSGTPPKQVISDVMHSQWSGLVALLGDYGPWVYAANVADLQILGRLYGGLVKAASQSSEDEVLDAALSQPDMPSLLARLEATNYRQPSDPNTDLAALETAFWEAAQAQAQRGWEAWQARRG